MTDTLKLDCTAYKKDFLEVDSREDGLWITNHDYACDIDNEVLLDRESTLKLIEFLQSHIPA